jgi:adenylate kinase
MLSEMGSGIDHVVNISVDDEEIVKRLTGRRTCSACGAGYHVIFDPPEKEGVCDKCGGSLIQRKDDTEGTIRSRLKVYRDQTEPLIAFYNGKGLLRTIPGEGKMEEIFDTVLKALAGDTPSGSGA